jgi:hypothetical protein
MNTLWTCPSCDSSFSSDVETCPLCVEPSAGVVGCATVPAMTDADVRTADLHNVLAAADTLLHVRGAVCRALRQGADSAEIAALLVAEEHATEGLRAAMAAQSAPLDCGEACPVVRMAA